MGRNMSLTKEAATRRRTCSGAATDVPEGTVAVRLYVGRQLRDARREAGLRQVDLSAISGVGINTITRCERGSISVSLDTLARLAAALATTFVVGGAATSASPPHAQPSGGGSGNRVRDQSAGSVEGYDLD